MHYAIPVLELHATDLVLTLALNIISLEHLNKDLVLGI